MMCSHLNRAERLPRDQFTACQASKRGGFLDCTLVGGRVNLGGNGITIIKGNCLLGGRRVL